MCVEAPVSNIIMNIHKKGIPILGICNGFQILIKLGLLSGRLIENRQKKFTSQLVKCNYNFKDYVGSVNMYIANYYGNYQGKIDNSNIFLRYQGFSNGSLDNIAGIHNDAGSVFGMMPHPERYSNFKSELLNILLYKRNHINKKIDRLLNSEHISYKSTKKFLRGLLKVFSGVTSFLYLSPSSKISIPTYLKSDPWFLYIKLQTFLAVTP